MGEMLRIAVGVLVGSWNARLGSSPEWLLVFASQADAGAATFNFSALLTLRWERAVTFNQRK